MPIVAREALKRHLPDPLISAIRRSRRVVRRRAPWVLVKTANQIIHRGSARQCPVCGSWVKRFVRVKADMCPVCRAVGRTRLVWLYLSRHTNLLTKPQSVLHIAPERGIAALLMNSPHIDYWAGDLEPDRYMIPKRMTTMDLTDAPFEDDRFDMVICNHVLEHIPDDKAAMREILRILKPGGSAVLQVPAPHKLPVTIEDPDAPPEERARRFGRAVHVRLYGADYAERLESIGFDVNVWLAREREPELCKRWTLDPREEVYVGTKAGNKRRHTH